MCSIKGIIMHGERNKRDVRSWEVQCLISAGEASALQLEYRRNKLFNFASDSYRGYDVPASA